MSEPDVRDRQIATLRERLPRLSDASLRINESLDTVVGQHDAGSVFERAHQHGRVGVAHPRQGLRFIGQAELCSEVPVWS